MSWRPVLNVRRRCRHPQSSIVFHSLEKDMRNPKIFVAVAPAVLALVLTGFTATAAAQGKVASIRSAELVLKSPQYKASQDKMKQEFEKRGKEFEGEAKKFEEDLKKFQKEADLLSAADRASRQKELETRKIDLGYKQQQLQQDMQGRSQQLEKDMRAKIQTVIEQIAKEKGLDLVLQDPVFASAEVDITEDVLKKLATTK
jgi:outer membrane protein